MPAAFTKSFADRLNQCCPLTVTEAGHPMPVEPGNIYIGKGGADMLITMRSGKLTVPPGLGSPVAFCGIARPQQFFAQVHDAGITPAAEVVFRDHHFYQTKDLDRLLAMRRKTGAVGFLTTEKDAVNLGPLRAHLDPFAVATLRLTLDTPNEIVDAILAKTIFLNK